MDDRRLRRIIALLPVAVALAAVLASRPGWPDGTPPNSNTVYPVATPSGSTR